MGPRTHGFPDFFGFFFRTHGFWVPWFFRAAVAARKNGGDGVGGERKRRGRKETKRKRGEKEKSERKET